MAIEFTKTEYKGAQPTIWRGECKILPGGFKPVQTFPAGTVLFRGTPLYVDFDKMEAAVCKAAKVLAGGSASAPRVPKGLHFAKDEYVLNTKDKTKAVKITAVDTTNDSYDTLTLSAATAAFAENDILVECKSTAATDGGNYDLRYLPNAVLGADKEITGKGIPTLDAAYDAVVLYSHVNYPLVPDWVQGMCLKNNPNILFIKQ